MVWTSAPALAPLDGTETILGTSATIRDFWAFAMSDLRTNNVRGYFAEFLVREAVGATHPRVEWDSADVVTPDGVRIEVKSSAYLQVWAQRRPSRIVFSGLRSRVWSPERGYAEETTFNADVYVMAVQTAQDHDTYDPLDAHQWVFWVLPARTLAARGAASLSLTTLEGLTDSVTFDGLAAKVATCAAIERE